MTQSEPLEEQLPSFQAMKLGQHRFIAARDPAHLARLRRAIGHMVQHCELETGKCFYVRSQNKRERGVHVWCLSIPASHIPLSDLLAALHQNASDE